MLKLTKKADYGLIALTHLAAHPEQGSASAKEIAERYRIPLPLLSKVLQKLARTGILAAEYGTKGGYRLARDPRRISALEVIRAIDGPVNLACCFTDLDECDQSTHCTVREPLRKVHEGILNLLSGISITDISDPGGWETRDPLYKVSLPAPAVFNS
jgi:Rrf2 family protein